MIQLFSAPEGTSIYKEITSRKLNATKNEATVEIAFAKETTYMFCMENQGNQKQHTFFEFPLQNSETIGSSTQLNEGVNALQFLGKEISQTAEVVKEAIEKMAVIDETYSEMEDSMYLSFAIKASVLFLVCVLQCWLFMRMIGKKTIEYKKVSIPI